MDNCKQKLLKNINELCDNCPIHEKLDSEKQHFNSTINDIKSINSDQYFFQYLKDEINKSNQKIKNLLKHELEASDKYREGRTSLYLAHKEHIRYINELLKTKQTTKYFKSIFKTEELFIKASNQLISNGFIKKSNDKLEWIYTPTKGLTTKQTLIALCAVLQKEDYLKHNAQSLYKNLEYEFGIKIDKGNFSKSFNLFKKFYTDNHSSYYNYIELFNKIL